MTSYFHSQVWLGVQPRASTCASGRSTARSASTSLAPMQIVWNADLATAAGGRWEIAPVSPRESDELPRGLLPSEWPDRSRSRATESTEQTFRLLEIAEIKFGHWLGKL